MHYPTVTVVLNWKGLKNKLGLYSVYLRITIERTSKYYTVPLPMKVSAEDWTGREDAWVRNTHPFSFEINSKIREKREVIYALIKRHYNLGKPLAFETIFKTLRRKDDGSLLNSYFKAYIRERPEKLEEATWQKYEACLQHLNAFNPKISFPEVDEPLVKNFKKYLEQKLGL